MFRIPDKDLVDFNTLLDDENEQSRIASSLNFNYLSLVLKLGLETDFVVSLVFWLDFGKLNSDVEDASLIVDLVNLQVLYLCLIENEDYFLVHKHFLLS
jgi:hypothetical protein